MAETLDAGTLVEVREFAVGGELAAPVEAGSMGISLLDAVDFEEDGGLLRIGEEVLAYLSADLESDAIQLAEPLAGSYEEGEQVYVYPEHRERIASVQYEDQGEAITARVPHALYDRVPEGIRDEPELVTLELDGPEWVLADVLGKEPAIDGGFIDPETLPTVEPDPPEVPEVVVTGFPRGFMVQVLNGRPGWTYTYSVVPLVGEDGEGAEQFYPDTGRSIMYHEALPDGSPFVAEAQYRWRVAASNEAGSAATELLEPVALVLNDDSTIAELAVGKLRAGDLVGAFALLGSLQVGQITIDPDTGITIPLDDGGQIKFPADGSDAEITAMLRAKSLLVEDNLTIQGVTNAIEGGLLLADGVSNPTVPPRVGPTWEHPDATRLFGPDTEIWGIKRGLNYLGGNRYMTGISGYGGQAFVLESGASSVQVVDNIDLGDFQPYGGIGRAASTGELFSYANKLGEWTYRLTRWNADGGSRYSIEYPYNDLSGKIASVWVNDEGGVPKIYVARMAGPTASSSLNRIVIRRFTRTFTQDAVWTFELTDAPRDVTGVVRLTDPVEGTSHFYVSTLRKVYALQADGRERHVNEEWSAPSGREIHGLAHDGSRFVMLYMPEASGAMPPDAGWGVYFGSDNREHTWREVGYTWRDSDAGGTGTHETAIGATTAWRQQARQWMRVETNPPNDTGQPDDPDSVRIYVDGKAQPDLPPGQTVSLYNVPSTSGSAPPTSNGFDTITGASGWIRSGAEDGDGALVEIRGDGAWRLGELFGDSTGKAGTDTGTMNATGSGFAGSFRAWRLGPVVFIVGACSKYDLLGFTWTNTGVTLPPAFRPSALVEFPVSSTWTSYAGWGYRILADGSLQVRRDTLSNASMPLASPYFV